MYVYFSTTMQVKPLFKKEKKCSKEKKTCFFLIQINNDKKNMCVTYFYQHFVDNLEFLKLLHEIF